MLLDLTEFWVISNGGTSTQRHIQYLTLIYEALCPFHCVTQYRYAALCRTSISRFMFFPEPEGRRG